MASSRLEFDVLLEQAQRPVLGYLIRLTGSVHAAQDLLQSANVTAIEKQLSFSPGTNFVAWFRQIAFNHHRNRVRKLAAARSVELVDEGLHAAIEQRHRQRCEQQHKQSHWRRLGDCLGQLPEHQRRMVEQFYLDGQSLQDIADQTGRKPNAIGQTLHRARMTLIRCVRRSAHDADTPAAIPHNDGSPQQDIPTQ